MHLVEEEAQFRGPVTFLDAKLNTGCVQKSHVQASAGIEADKLEHQHRAICEQESDTTATAQDHVVHVVKGLTGTIKTVKAGCVVSCVGDATITVDLHKNGTTVLTGAITLTSAQAAYELVAGTIENAAVVADDVLEIVVTVDAGTGTLGKGMFAYVDLFEDVS